MTNMHQGNRLVAGLPPLQQRRVDPVVVHAQYLSETERELRICLQGVHRGPSAAKMKPVRVLPGSARDGNPAFVV